MSDFSADWLALREPVDASARSHELLSDLQAWRKNRARLKVVDLGAGTGSNLRYLAPRLGGVQEWLLVDYATDLLEVARGAVHRWALGRGLEISEEGSDMRVALPGGDCRVASKVLDLADGLAGLDLAHIDLVTGSALLDLVSEAWLTTLAEACTAAGCTVFFALTYDGEIEWQPQDSRDAVLLSLVNRHQRTDKGFGPALGPLAAERCADILRRYGYRVSLARSNWRLGASDQTMQRTLAADWAAAAREMAPDQEELINDWLGERVELISQSASSLRVGHQDLLGTL